MTKNNNTQSIIDEDADYLPHTNLVDWIDEWSFKSANTATYTHKIHRYPAMFIPQLVRKIIEEYTKEGELVLDIFNGSGSTMVECCLLNRNSIGIEINPLANLIAKVKTTALKKDSLIKNFDKLEADFFNKKTKFNLIDFKNIDFWFEATAKECVSKILVLIDAISNKDESDFFKICLSEIIREVSTCKHSGFKMHRDVAKVGKEISEQEFFDRYKKTYLKNLSAIDAFSVKVNGLNYKKTQIQGSSTQLQKSIKENSVDLILTSPPYGDSQTTVAYGQFSRLSSQCFGLTLEGLADIGSLDNELLGGKKLNKDLYDNLCSRSLTIKNVAEFFVAKINDDALSKEDKKKLEVRLNDVMSFYYDLDMCLKNGAYYLKKNKHFILVTGSRVVKMIKLHTDLIIAELAEEYDLALTAIFYRNIENKRMPAKVSATNVVGEHAPTMTRESIIVLKKLI
jgi:16S rRNA G966 N2-methylase RsmD